MLWIKLGVICALLLLLTNEIALIIDSENIVIALFHQLLLRLPVYFPRSLQVDPQHLFLFCKGILVSPNNFFGLNISSVKNNYNNLLLDYRKSIFVKCYTFTIVYMQVSVKIWENFDELKMCPDLLCRKLRSDREEGIMQYV